MYLNKTVHEIQEIIDKDVKNYSSAFLNIIDETKK